MIFKRLVPLDAWSLTFHKVSLKYMPLAPMVFSFYISRSKPVSKYSSMTIEEIQQQCETLSNEQLFLVVNNKQLYNEMIVRVTYQEIRKRGLSKQEVKEIEKAQARRAKIITEIFTRIYCSWKK